MRSTDRSHSNECTPSGPIMQSENFARASELGWMLIRQETVVRGHHGPICMVMSEGGFRFWFEWMDDTVNFFFLFISFLPGNEYILTDGMKKIFENKLYKLDRNIDEDEIER